MEKYNDEYCIESLPCAGLVEFIEQGVLEGERIRRIFKAKV